MTDLRTRLVARVGGMEAFASSFADRTMRDLDRRAEREISEAVQLIEQTVERVGKALAGAGLEQFAEPVEPLVDSLIDKWSAFQHAGARTANWMVTGPSNFPVRRMQKRMDTEHRRWQELDEACKLAPDRAVKRARAAQKQAIGPVGVVDAELQDLRDRLERRERRHARFKAVNELIRRHKLGAGDGAQLHALLQGSANELDLAVCHQIMRPAWAGAPIGFASFTLSNNNAEMKRLRGRIAQVEAKAERVEQAESAERVVNGVTVVEDALDDRLRLIFDGKPAPDVISKLKSRGFRWSPRAGAWQRQLTQNARDAAEGILKQLEAA